MFPRSIVCCYLYVISKYGYPPPADRMVDYLREMKAMGFRAVELEGIHAGNLRAVYDRRLEIRQALDELQLEVPYFCVVLPELAAASAEARAKNLELFEMGCDIARLFGAKGVLDNAPLPPYQFPADMPVVRHYDANVLLQARLPETLNWKSYWNELVFTYRQACDIAGARGLTYQLHPCLGVLAATTDAFLYFYDAVDRANLRFNLDTANQFFLKDNLALSLLRLADHIDYIHLSDNRGNRVEHRVPGDGMIDWDTFFATLKRAGFHGDIGIDVGGDETGLADIETAYIRSADWLVEHWH